MTTLAELRQASLKEQRQKEQIQHTPDPAPAESAPDTSVPAASPADSVPTPGTNGHHAPSPAPAVPIPAPPPAPVLSAEAVKAEQFFTRLHESLSHKTLHPSGAKVSADMPPALFHRAKRYCLDNGNITLRQVLIDLLTCYLEEEGY